MEADWLKQDYSLLNSISAESDFSFRRNCYLDLALPPIDGHTLALTSLKAYMKTYTSTMNLGSKLGLFGSDHCVAAILFTRP